MKKILFVYPEYPDTFWGFKRVMRIIRRKAAFPPLGLLTVAAMLPEYYQKKLVDMNVSFLRDEDIKNADYVFVGAMITQKESAKIVIKRCNDLGTKVVVGGPLFTTGYHDFKGISHYILGEAEDIFPKFLEDLENNRARMYYVSNSHPNVGKAPVPLWELINPRDYVSLSMQISRGCPFNCEFCDIIVMNGRIPRVKGPEQVLRELNAIKKIGFHGTVLVVDDNFIGNKAKVRDLLVEMIDWQKWNDFPFSFTTEASINLADDEVLMSMMAEAGFNQVFLGLETPSSASLTECGKNQNTNRDVVASIKRIQAHGINTFGGFIVGFDSDTKDIFEAQIKFIQEAGVVVAMVGMLQALPKTRLYKRLLGENRISAESSGNNTDCFINFVPKMDREVLIAGYRKILKTIYSPKKYYERLCIFLSEYNPKKTTKRGINWFDILAFIGSIWHIGIMGRWSSKWYYWKMLIVASFKYRKAFPEAVTMLIYGLHLYEIAEDMQ
jgi:radical SAM superfamily enzyme YgiQ (UPF0313 family)